MPETRIFLDDEHRIVPERRATRMVVRITDDQGALLSEHWYEQALPNAKDLAARVAQRPADGNIAIAALASGLLGLLLGLLIRRW